MTAVPFTPEQERKLAEFDAAPQLAESSPMTRAMLALAEELERHGKRRMAKSREPGNERAKQDRSAALARLADVDMLRTTVAAVLAADPEPRDAVIERMARAMWTDQYPFDHWDSTQPGQRDHYRRLAASALEAIGAPE